ncbi:CRISPR-associated helicase Cas3' [Bombiscardovia apis]|nr:CRISPR-associated helicase Cas3' [Bombiscardovia apis]
MKKAFDLGLMDAEFAIAGHHAGLPDGGSDIDAPGTGTLAGRLKAEFPDASHWQDEIQLPACNPTQPKSTYFSMMMRTRMHESALVDADRLDAEFFVNGQVERDESELLSELKEELGPDELQNSHLLPAEKLEKCSKQVSQKIAKRNARSIGNLAAIMENRAEQFLSRSATTSLNEKRNSILRDCLERGADSSWKPGLYTLTAPTGSGKTDSSLTFALEHAKTHGLSRVIYVVPYTSIIDQTVKDFVKLLGKDNVLPHYADASFQLKEKDELSKVDLHRSFAAENWNMPVIVTTAVQFFESLFASNASKLRKLHNIANSVVVFDEAQTLPIPYLKPCIWAISDLVQSYGVSAVLCTATQPALEEMFREAMRQPALHIPEIAPLSQEERDQFKRNRIELIGHKTLDEMSQLLSNDEQVLCVVNTREEAQMVYQQLQDRCGPDGNYCLTTLQCPYDRDALLEEIRGRLAAGKSCRVVSTSLIEAGVDVDFPTAYREETGLDSILQAAGRCNREGLRDTDESIVGVFSTDEGKVAFTRQNVDAFRSTSEKFDDIASGAAVHDYFTRLFNLKGEHALDQKRILPMHERGYEGCQMPFKVIEKNFKLIDTPTVPVYVPINDDARDLCQRLMNPEQHSRSLFRRLGRYSVSVWPKHLDVLRRLGKVEPIDDEETAYILTDVGVYNSKLGLQVKEGQVPQLGDFQ